MALALLGATGLVGAPTASASRPPLPSLLEDLWEYVLETPRPQNPLVAGDPCVELERDRRRDRIVTPFGPLGGAPITCTVPAGTRLFVIVWSSECSNRETGDFDGGNTRRSLRKCARRVDRGITTTELLVDGQPEPVREVVTDVIRFTLPADNVLENPDLAGPGGRSAAHGWVVLLRALPPGTHTLTLHSRGVYLQEEVDFTSTTTIVVTAGR